MTLDTPKKNNLKLIFCVLSVITTAGVLGLTFFNQTLMKTCFLNTSYYGITLLVVLWIWALFKYFEESRVLTNSWWPSHWKGLVVAGLLSLIVFMSVEPSLRVLSDEANLMAVSRSMTYNKSAANITQGYFYYRNFYIENSVKAGIEKKPQLFPYFTHLIHVVRGYRPENVYLLNILVLFAFLCMIYALLIDSLKNLWTFSAMILVTAQPIVSQCATSGGFDLFAGLLVLISFYALRQFILSPSAARFGFLWLSLVMLPYARMELGVFFIIIPLGLLFLRRLKREHLQPALIYAMTPALLLPLIWQNRLLGQEHHKLLGQDFEQVAGQAAFSARYFIKHNVLFLKDLFDYQFFLPYATLVNLAGFAGILYFVFLCFTNNSTYQTLVKNKNRVHLLLISSVCLLAQWVIITSFYRGDPNHPSCARYYVLFSALLSVAATVFAKKTGLFDKRPAYFLVLSILGFMLYHPVSIESRFCNTQSEVRQYNFTIEYLKKNAGKNILVIADRAGHYAIHEYGSITFDVANSQKRLIISNLNRHLQESAYVIQEIEYSTGLPVEGNRLDPEYTMKRVATLQNSPVSFIQISRIVNRPKDLP